VSTGFSPGDLVFARGREWVALPSPSPELLCLRPLSGTESDAQILLPDLEPEPPRPAQFSLPDLDRAATQDAAKLLSEALQLSLRRGAGPFRSAARVGFEPRAYQLVPLLMALRLPVIRLLIADDVGIGKTIEAGLILRELIDRGEVNRFTVLCPPHLVEQWTGELSGKFDLDTVAVTASSAARLERGLATSQTLFDAYPQTVVSLDYIKAEKRRENFARICPAMVIVDEAHTCVGTHLGRQQRFNLLQRLAQDKQRHMLFLTATPHSGDEDAFGRLLSLLDPSLGLDSLRRDREHLARHFVQRRRIDITSADWGGDRVFPKHQTREASYKLGAEHEAFHDVALNYCLGVVDGAGPDHHRRRLAFWGTLALMRCVGSSPAAAASTLRNRLAAEPDKLEEQVFDDEAEDADAVDVEPAAGLEGEGELAALVRRAEQLTRGRDPKLEAVIREVRPLLAAKANPVLFCRFIATAEHVAAGLRKAFPGLRIEAVTGALTTEERRTRVDAMGEAEQRLLVATDCLSEGINLQALFDTVVHYDLSWNPTRHQQREGRVDRFGQPAREVRSILLYSPDSAIDGAVLDVILRKARKIRDATGVTVPLPEDKGAITGALMNAVLLHTGTHRRQLTLDLGFAEDDKRMNARWRDAEEGEKRSRAIFAQNAMKPQEVIPEWNRWRALLGGPEGVRRFVLRALTRLQAGFDDTHPNDIRVNLASLPLAVRERLAARELEGSVRLSFEEPPSSGAAMVTRTHALPATLAESLLEAALDPSLASLEPLGRTGAWRSQAVTVLTTVLLLRLRFTLTVHSRREQVLLAEESAALALPARGKPIPGDAARALLDPLASSELATPARSRLLAQARERAAQALDAEVAELARQRAEILAADHARVRNVAGVPRVSVAPVLPADVVGLFVLVPAEG